MKIVFVNPPVIRSENSSPENDFKVEGFVFPSWLNKVPRLIGILHKFGVGKGVRYGVRAGSRWPWTSSLPVSPLHYPFIMAYSVSVLREKGFDCTLIDAVAEGEYSYSHFLDRLKDEKADLVVVECSTPTIDIDIWIANKLAAFADVCLAGPHLTSHCERLMAENPKIKYFLKGEYINSCVEMVQTLRPGIYRTSVVDDLDSLPFPFRDYPVATKYFDPSMPTAKPQLQIYASKGCPFKCTFCMWPQTMYEHKVSLRKPELVAKEIRYCVERYGFRSIFFDDDTFNLGTERISVLCDELKKIGLPWTMMGRLDCSPTWLYDKMVDCGCVGMRFGIETFDPQVLQNIKKGLESEGLEQTLSYISNKHPQLMLHVTMMKNLPGQTGESHLYDMKILSDLGYSEGNIYRSYQLSSCAPFPGTELYESLSTQMDSDQLDEFRLYDGGQNTIMNHIKKEDKP